MANKNPIMTSIFSVFFSVIASSHHWLHMAILFILGGSSSLLASTGFTWVRRFMIAATIVTMVMAIIRTKKHYPMMKTWVKVLTLVSIVLSLGFIGFTVINYGL